MKSRHGVDSADKDENPRRKLTTYKYSENGKGTLYEAVLINGKPYFIFYNRQTKNIEGAEQIGDTFRILQPPEPSEYSYRPYEFKDKTELVSTYLETRKHNLDTLLAKANSIISKFNDQDDYKLKAIGSDVVWSYFQDRFATTRYEVLTGGVGSGKSALAATYGAIGYRPVNTTNPTAAVIYRLLGNIEPGQCTMILEEAEKIDQVYEIMAILKTGYTRDGKVDRTNPVSLKPEFFNSYCFKIIVAERSPNQDSGKGVVDRSFIYSCFRGHPQFDIKEILNPTNTGGPEHQILRDDLEYFRKVLLMYRLVHFKDDIGDMGVGLIGRDKELVKPTLQLFQGTKSQDDLIKIFQTILDLKNSRKATALHSALLDVVSIAIANMSKSIPTIDGKVELPAKEYWSKLPERIEGRLDEQRPGVYHSIDFGPLYSGTVGKILHDNFGIESYHTRRGNMLVITLDTIQRLKSQFNSKIVVKGVNLVKDSEDGYTQSLRLHKIDGGRLYPRLHLPSRPSRPSTTIRKTCKKCGEQLEPEPFYAKLHNCLPKV